MSGPPGVRGRRWRSELGETAVVYAAVAIGLGIVAVISHAALSPGPIDSGPAGRTDLWAFSNWDAGWYFDIAERGYNYRGPNQQSSVAFFPAYPGLMRLVGIVVGDTLLGGVIVTYVAGLVAALGVRRTTSALGGPSAAGSRAVRAAVLLFLLSPFAYYFFGVVYADALFVAACIWAMLLFRANRLVAAAIVGMVATAARPLGMALTIGLVVAALAYDPDGRTRRWIKPSLPDLRRRLPRLIAAGATSSGLFAYMGLLWWRFGDPFVFARVEGAAGWNKGLGWDRVLKRDFFRMVSDGDGLVTFGLGLAAALFVLGCVLLPAISRRLGPDYGAFTALVLVVPFLSTGDMIGMGRYFLAAFAVPITMALLLRDRPRVVVTALALSTAALVVTWSYYVRDFYLS